MRRDCARIDQIDAGIRDRLTGFDGRPALGAAVFSPAEDVARARERAKVTSAADDSPHAGERKRHSVVANARAAQNVLRVEAAQRALRAHRDLRNAARRGLARHSPGSFTDRRLVVISTATESGKAPAGDATRACERACARAPERNLSDRRQGEKLERRALEKSNLAIAEVAEVSLRGAIPAREPSAPQHGAASKAHIGLELDDRLRQLRGYPRFDFGSAGEPAVTRHDAIVVSELRNRLVRADPVRTLKSFRA